MNKWFALTETNGRIQGPITIWFRVFCKAHWSLRGDDVVRQLPVRWRFLGNEVFRPTYIWFHGKWNWSSFWYNNHGCVSNIIDYVIGCDIIRDVVLWWRLDNSKFWTSSGFELDYNEHILSSWKMFFLSCFPLWGTWASGWERLLNHRLCKLVFIFILIHASLNYCLKMCY